MRTISGYVLLVRSIQKSRLANLRATATLATAFGFWWQRCKYSQPIGALTQVNFGSGDNDQFSYDVNTGRLTNYTFNVGSPAQTDVGQLTWNANGSLKTLQI